MYLIVFMADTSLVFCCRILLLFQANSSLNSICIHCNSIYFINFFRTKGLETLKINSCYSVLQCFVCNSYKKYWQVKRVLYLIFDFMPYKCMALLCRIHEKEKLDFVLFVCFSCLLCFIS